MFDWDEWHLDATDVSRALRRHCKDGRLTGHSIRITAATHLRIQGASVAEIMHFGRWKAADSIGGYLRGVAQGLRGVTLPSTTRLTDFPRVLSGFLTATLLTPS